uniref:Uncharacterized protein n=1 Tax=Grammatophora oceanica TaxID=210454 RepID=A0A7S1VEU9_9STRA|mmetsp:Transcript_43179/g.64035  ORF Transcript_43179/g.64035 Transcript_43179/m.64035 type:complete len:106 (+) Transcript_43179:566-883(+)
MSASANRSTAMFPLGVSSSDLSCSMDAHPSTVTFRVGTYPIRRIETYVLDMQAFQHRGFLGRCNGFWFPISTDALPSSEASFHLEAFRLVPGGACSVTVCVPSTT